MVNYCKDVMTYKTVCRANRFVDKDVRCGEHKAHDCKGGGPTQNSYRRLMSLLGPRDGGACTTKACLAGRCLDKYSCEGKREGGRCAGPSGIRCCPSAAS